MKCHDDKENQNKKSSSFKHALHMIICCGLPILIILLVPFVARYNPALSGIMALAAPFICPLIMGGMFFSMFRGNKTKKSCCSSEGEETPKAIS